LEAGRCSVALDQFGSADENLTGSTGFAPGQQGAGVQGADRALCPYEHLALRLAIAPAV
jgi:hypothetical protein